MTTENSWCENFPPSVSEQFEKLKAVEDGSGSIWFYAEEVLSKLKIQYCDAIKILNNDEKAYYKNQLLISEPGLYNLLLSVNNEETRAFRKWVFGQVVPTILNSGVYANVNIKEDNHD